MTDTPLAPSYGDDDTRPRPKAHPLLHTFSAVMRSVLIAHLDGAQPVVVASPRHPTVTALIRRNLLRFDAYKPPRQSFLTDKGRDAASACAEFEAARILEMEMLR